MRFLSWKLAGKNLFRSPRRSITTSISIIVGFVGLLLISGYIFRVHNMMKSSAVFIDNRGHLAILKHDSFDRFYSKPSKYVLSQSDLQNIDLALEGVKEFIDYKGSYLSGSGLISNGKMSAPFIGVGLEGSILLKNLNHPLVYKWIDDLAKVQRPGSQHFSEDPSALSMTTAMADVLGMPGEFSSLSDQDKSLQISGLSFYGSFNAVNANLRQQHTTGMLLLESTNLRTQLSVMQDLYQTDGVQYLALYLKNDFRTSYVKSQLQKYFSKSNMNYDIYTYYDEDWSPYYVGTMNFLYVMGFFFIFLIFGTVCLTIMNSCTLGVLERLREIGTLRSIGYSPFQIQTLFVKENFLLAIVSSFIGIILALIISSIVNSMELKFRPPGTIGDFNFTLNLNPFFIFVFLCILIFTSILTTFLVTKKYTYYKVIDLLSDSGG